MTIKILDPRIAEKIAAGEVIENPASVVKELVENSLDAGATRIEIRIEVGGKKRITVIDDGCGMAPEELPLAFQRFATSKLAVLDDLNRIITLGFRGEALPSIAAVSRVTITSRPRGALAAARLSLEGGQITAREEIGAPEGTAVEVRDLFYNTPGRLKFLRSDPVELGRISALLTGLVLAHPETAFILASESKQIIQTAGDGNLLHAIGALYGHECAAAMIPLPERESEQVPGLAVTGFIAAPHYHRPSRKQITAIINGRVVRNFQVIAALERGYGGFLPRQRYPVAVLHLRIPPHLLDVNVHPAKAEVRFARPDLIVELVYKAVRAALHKPPLQSRPAGNRAFEDDVRVPMPGFPWRKGRQVYMLEPAGSGAAVLTPQAGPETLAEATPAEDHLASSTSCAEAPPPPAGAAAISPSRLLGQFLQSYLVVQRGEELLLIDQHAAHERIIYESLVPEKAGRSEAIQLTVPLEIELPLHWREPVKELLPLLSEMGYKLEPFGDNSYIIRAMPFASGAPPTAADFCALLEELVEAAPAPGESRREQVRKTVACHRAVKAHQPLSTAEMEALLKSWEETPGATYCPHGRPAVISFQREELEKGFRREGRTGNKHERR